MHSFPKLPARILPISFRDFLSILGFFTNLNCFRFAQSFCAPVRKISQCDCALCLNFLNVSYKLRSRFTWFIEGVIMERQVIENLKCKWSYESYNKIFLILPQISAEPNQIQWNRTRSNKRSTVKAARMYVIKME